MTTDSKAAEDRMHAAIDRIAGERLNVRLLTRRAGRRDEATVHPILDRVLRDGLATAYREGVSAALASTARAAAGDWVNARWLPIETAPTDRPVVVRMRTDRLSGGWFVATVTLPDPEDESRFAGSSTIWHYNGDILMSRFRGTWTHWLCDDPAVPASPRSGAGEEGCNWEEWFTKQIAYSESFREAATRMGVDHPYARGRTSAFQEMQERFLAGTKVVTGELEGYLLRQIKWSRSVFGEKLNAIGITRHIEKECAEIRASPTDLSEWCDVITLALDGFWRHGGEPSSLINVLNKNQTRNIARKWNVSKDPNVPSEHDRSGEASPPALAEHGVEIREAAEAAFREGWRACIPDDADTDDPEAAAFLADLEQEAWNASQAKSLSQGGQAGGSEKGKGEEEARRAIRFAMGLEDHWDRFEFLNAFMGGDLSEWPEFTKPEPDPAQSPSTSDGEG